LQQIFIKQGSLAVAVVIYNIIILAYTSQNPSQFARNKNHGKNHFGLLLKEK
jgi:hypothetical protein